MLRRAWDHAHVWFAGPCMARRRDVGMHGVFGERALAVNRKIGAAAALAVAVATVAACTAVTRQTHVAPPPQVAGVTVNAQQPVTTAPHPRVRPRPVGATGQGVGNPPKKQPNIIYVLTDDLSTDLVPFMPHVVDMKRRGLSFTHFFATDSLCCPSRSSILTGKFPHDTGVFDNTAPDGGFDAYVSHGNVGHTFATVLHKVGYRTGFMGKFLNGYKPHRWEYGHRPWVSPGWDVWMPQSGGAYNQYNYWMADNQKLTHYGTSPRDYSTTVLSNHAARFVRQSARTDKPFMLEVATYAPHRPFTPAKQDLHKFPWLRAPRSPAYAQPVRNATSWLSGFPAMTQQEERRTNAEFRKRVRSVQAVDRMIGRLEKLVWNLHLQRETYIIFSSDNGYHLGEHELRAGKQTAFDTDIRVPLVVVGPGVPAGKKVDAMTANIDMCPTFEDLGGATIPADVDGRSLAPWIRGKHPKNWRDAVLVEHHGPDTDPSDPDFPGKHSGNPPSYAAIRTHDSLYVEYVTGAQEYYNLRTDPWEMDNQAGSMPASLHHELASALHAMQDCHGGRQCWKAAHLRTR